jgi:hypothetical protein
VRVVPAKTRSLEVPAGGDEPPQFAPVLQLLSPPPPDHVLVVWAQRMVGVETAAQRK